MRAGGGAFSCYGDSVVEREMRRRCGVDGEEHNNGESFAYIIYVCAMSACHVKSTRPSK
jgi:hypothetical protein